MIEDEMAQRNAGSSIEKLGRSFNGNIDYSGVSASFDFQDSRCDERRPGQLVPARSSKNDLTTGHAFDQARS